MPTPPTESAWLQQAAQGGMVAAESAFHRLWRGFMVARVGTALVLLVLLWSMQLLGLAPAIDSWQIILCAAYLGASLGVVLAGRPARPGQHFDPQWVFTIGIDLLAFATLHVTQAAGLNFSPLFALPVLTASVLGSALLALGTAAGVTLLLLIDAWVQALQLPEAAPRFVQAGLTGGGFFVVALLANQLAARLAREEQLARRSRLAARTQAQVNELVIETLADGVVVLAPDAVVQAANPAARQLLGWDDTDAPVSLMLASRPGWQPLVDLAERTFAEQASQQAELALEIGPGERVHLRVRTRLTPPHEQQSEALCVMFLQDLREAEARLRTEKLAAMGRMSAAVAHEIRNPLAAIAQANALLAEDLARADQKQLSDMVGKNTQRLAQIVDEILNIARVQQQPAAPVALELDAAVQASAGEWSRHARPGPRLRVQPGAPGHWARFDPEHLRRVLVNLLDNALRYASTGAGAIVVATESHGDDRALRVWSDGPPLEATVQRHLFEPFFSSESRSSGLGLYICRELCERHGATIAYDRAPAPDGSGRPGNLFTVVLRPAAPAPTAAGAARAVGG
ncbi:PAS domain-containing sensor histidine kinase [Ramlibacter sp.]|uniref:sensor histidine kinase n=1 Tax=Ramlibacter sp. TaxID=1917967 RepID=UPI0035AFDB42